jgi:hypothetical protein
MACTVSILASRVANPTAVVVRQASNWSIAANSSIVRRFTHLSYWFEAPILWFGALCRYDWPFGKTSAIAEVNPMLLPGAMCSDRKAGKGQTEPD